MSAEDSIAVEPNAVLPRSGKRRWPMFAVLLIAMMVLASAYFFRPLPYAAPKPLASLDATAERGEYLAKIGNCSACHSLPGQPAFSGGVKFKTQFGTIYSTNITSDRNKGIGRWSYEQFHASMKHGIRPDGSHLYPAFPYTSFAKMSDGDIASLYLHFRSIAPVAVANRENDLSFPFNNRALLHFWKRLYHDDAAFVPKATKSQAWNRGAYLVDAVAHCGACHTPRNMLGGLNDTKALQGGSYVDQVANGTYRSWSAVDLTPGQHGLRHWNAEDFVAYLTKGKNRHVAVHGPMNEVFASTSQLAFADAEAIAAFLKGAPPSKARMDLSFFRSGISEGEIVYTVHCGTCHLPDGKGTKTLGASLHNNALVQAKDPASLINVILYGPDLPPPPFVSGRTSMKPFGKRLSDEDIAALATYLRSSFDNNASEVSADQVEQQR
jgi:mono/diheme cytochrome c family protein